MILTLLVVSALVFVIIQLPEGDYLTSYIAELESQGEAVDPQKIAYLKEEFGLDKPVWLQYLSWIGGVVQGDFVKCLYFLLFSILALSFLFILLPFRSAFIQRPINTAGVITDLPLSGLLDWRRQTFCWR